MGTVCRESEDVVVVSPSSSVSVLIVTDLGGRVVANTLVGLLFGSGLLVIVGRLVDDIGSSVVVKSVISFSSPHIFFSHSPRHSYKMVSYTLIITSIFANCMKSRRISYLDVTRKINFILIREFKCV